MTAAGPWYISAQAARDYLAIREMPVVSEGPDFEWATGVLVRLAQQTVASARIPTVTDRGTLQYRGPKPLRLRLIVAPVERAEGSLPQLVAVLPAFDDGRRLVARSPYREDRDGR